jgi:hypothetical protein
MKYQVSLPYDNSTLANFLAWAQGISTAMSTLGWIKTADTGQIVWGNLTTTPTASAYPFTGDGFWVTPAAWVGGTAYTTAIPATEAAFSVVTYAPSGLTYWCYNATQVSVSAGVTVAQNPNITLGSPGSPPINDPITACTTAGVGGSVYSTTGATAAMVGVQFVVTGMTASNNNGTFMCVAASAGTSITLNNPNATASTLQSGTAVSSPSVLTFSSTNTAFGTWVSGAGGLNSVAYAMAGHSIVVAVTGAGNSGTFTVTSAGQISSGAGLIAVTATGTSETGVNGTFTENTNPATDTTHWSPYPYEVWQTNDGLSPLYMRLVYGGCVSSPNAPAILFMIGTGTTGGGWITGNKLGASEIGMSAAASLSGTGATLWECDFCASDSGGSLSMMLWRTASSFGVFPPFIITIDRAKSSSGTDLDSYATYVGTGCGNSNPGNMVGAITLFKPGSAQPTMPATFYATIGTNINTWPVWAPYPSLTTLSDAGLQTPLPVFPSVGYMGNPLLGAICMKTGDCVEGGLISVYMYGSLHTFLMTKIFNYTPVPNCAIGIRWE